MNYLKVVPAYGRDYRTAKAAKEAWAEGKDFRINDMFNRDDGRYVNKDDAPKGVKIQIRFDHSRKVVIINA